MDRLVCALFEDKPRAAAAIDALVNGGVGDEVASVVMHEGTVTHEDLGVAAGRSGHRMLQGAAIGAVIGGLIGAVLGYIVAPADALLPALITSFFVGAGAGVLYTTLAGAISGRDSEQPSVEKLSHAVESGKVLVTVEVRGAKGVSEQAKAILARYGGHHMMVS